MGSSVGHRQRPLSLVRDVVAQPLPLEPLAIGEHADAVSGSKAVLPPAAEVDMSANQQGVIERR